MEKVNIKSIAGPVDGNTAAITGVRVNMKEYKRVSLIFNMGDSTTATDVSFQLKQHNAASGGTTKALAISNAYFHKVGVATVFTKVEPSVANDDYDLTTLFANDEGVVVFEVLEEDLDVNGGFAWISVDLTDMGAAKLVSGLAVLHGGIKPNYNLSV